MQRHNFKSVLIFLLALTAGFAAFGSVQVMADDEGGNANRKFRLLGTARQDRDPENRANEVIRIRTDQSPNFGVVSRSLNARIQTLDNQLEFKAYFVAPKSCGGGAPRFQLAIDLDGDGQSDGNAFGYYGPLPGFTDCLSNTWRYEDLTDEEPRWDLSQFVGITTSAVYIPWSEVETLVEAFPNHKVCTGGLFDDLFPGLLAGRASPTTT